jgi:hypothetical protein
MMFKRDVPSITIKTAAERTPWSWRHWLALLALLGVLIFAGWRLYVLGGHNAGFDRDATSKVIRELNLSLAETTDTRDALNRELVGLERTLQIETEATKNLRDEMLLLQDERHQLREEVALLKKIMGDSSTDTILRVSAFSVFFGDNTDEYRFDAAVTRLPEADKAIKTVLDYVISGMQNGVSIDYSSAEIDTGSPEGHSVEFKQIGRLRGAFVLPADFQPETLTVYLRSEDKNSQDAEFRTLWQPVAANGVLEPLDQP